MAHLYDKNSGRVFYTPEVLLESGEYTVNLAGEDTVGEKVNLEWKFKIDVTPPVIANLSPAPERVLNNKDLVISATVYDEISGVGSLSLTLDNGTVTFTYIEQVVRVIGTPTLIEGSHTLCLSANNKMGNSADKQWSFFIDNNAPEVDIITSAGITIEKRRPILLARLTDLSEIGTISLKLDGMAVEYYFDRETGYFYYIPAIEEIHSELSLEVEDKAGNKSAKALQITHSGFTFTQLTPQANSIISNKATATIISVLVESAEVIATNTITLWIDSDTVSHSYTACTGTSGLISYTAATNTLSSGTHTITIGVTDTGNPSTKGTTTWSVMIDNDAPVFTEMLPAPGVTMGKGSLTITVKVTDNLAGINTSTINLEIDGVSATHTYTSGRVSCILPDGVLSSGIHTVAVRVNDLSSPANCGTTSWSFMIIGGNIDEVFCYPNPSSAGYIIFTNLPEQVRIRIFNIAGEEVFDRDVYAPNCRWQWDCVNSDGRKVASGIYIYVVTDGHGGKKVGKLGVVR